MNIENLKEGMVVKNYKELCKLLGLEPKKANSKKAQIKDMNTMFSFHTEGQKIIIDEIYEEAIPREDGRVGGYSEMRTLILRLLLLSKQSENRAVFPTSTLLRGINAVNINYATGKRNQEELGEYLDIDVEYIGEFYERTNSSLKGALETNLNDLQNGRFIFWSHVIMVCKNNSKLKKNELGEFEIDEEGNIVAEINQDFREATQEEKEKILKTEKEVLNSMGYESISEVFRHRVNKTFYKEVYRRLRKSCNISFYYLAYDITFIRSSIEKELMRIENVSDLKEKYILNKKVKDKILANANKRVENSKGSKSIKGILRQSDDYIINISKLIDTVIDMSAENIVEDLKSISSSNRRSK